MVPTQRGHGNSVLTLEVTSVVSDSLQFYGLEPAKLLYLWDFQGKNIGVGCHFLLEGIFLTQRSNPHLLFLLQEMGIQDHLTCLLRNLYAGQEASVELDMEKQTGPKSGKEYVKAVYCHPAYLTYMQSTS